MIRSPKVLNNTRSRALEDLVKFGFWLERQDPNTDVPEVTTILEKTFHSRNRLPFELAGVCYAGQELSFDLQPQ